MAVIPQSWRYIFRVYGISPRGNRRDRYFTGIAGFLFLAYTGILVPFWLEEHVHIIKCITISLYFVSTLFFLVYNYLCPDKYAELERDLKKIDRDLRAFVKAEVDMTSVSLIILLWLVFQVLVPLGHTIKLPFTLVARVWIGYVVMYMPILQQVLLVNQVTNRFSLLNDRLRSTEVGLDTPAVLDQAFRIHSNLHALVDDIDDHYCFKNLFNFSAMFITWTFNMYNILLLISGESDYAFYFNQYRVLTVTGYFLLQVLVCHSCSQTGNRTVLIAHRLLQPDTDPSIWDQVREFSSQVTDNKVYFTIGGIFTLDRTLVTKTALTALSYLIVAIQLKDVNVFAVDYGLLNATNITMATSPSTLKDQPCRLVFKLQVISQ